MTNPWVTLAIIIGVVAIIVWLWDDLTEELQVWVARDAAGTRPRAHTDRPRIASLVEITAFEIVTPRGVIIPPGLLNGPLDLDDALEWLDYVEALG